MLPSLIAAKAHRVPVGYAGAVVLLLTRNFGHRETRRCPVLALIFIECDIEIGGLEFQRNIRPGPVGPKKGSRVVGNPGV